MDNYEKITLKDLLHPLHLIQFAYYFKSTNQTISTEDIFQKIKNNFQIMFCSMQHNENISNIMPNMIHKINQTMIKINKDVNIKKILTQIEKPKDLSILKAILETFEKYIKPKCLIPIKKHISEIINITKFSPVKNQDLNEAEQYDKFISIETNQQEIQNIKNDNQFNTIMNLYVLILLHLKAFQYTQNPNTQKQDKLKFTIEYVKEFKNQTTNEIFMDKTRHIKNSLKNSLKKISHFLIYTFSISFFIILFNIKYWFDII